MLLLFLYSLRCILGLVKSEAPVLFWDEKSENVVCSPDLQYHTKHPRTSFLFSQVPLAAADGDEAKDIGFFPTICVES